MINKLDAIIPIMALILSASSAFAAEQGEIGALVGFTSTSDYGLDFAYGVTGNYKVTPNFGLGLTYAASNLGSSSATATNGNITASASTTASINFINANFNYYINQFWIGAKIGLSFLSLS